MQGRTKQVSRSRSLDLVAASARPLGRESSLSTTYWSESTSSSRCLQWNGLAPWEFELSFSGSLMSTFLVLYPNSSLQKKCKSTRWHYFTISSTVLRSKSASSCQKSISHPLTRPRRNVGPSPTLIHLGKVFSRVCGGTFLQSRSA